MRQPSVANRSAVSRPMPPPAPVITATLPSRRFTTTSAHDPGTSNDLATRPLYGPDPPPTTSSRRSHRAHQRVEQPLLRLILRRGHLGVPLHREQERMALQL